MATVERRLQEVRNVAGRAAPNQELLDKLMEGDFDPDEYDKQMTAAFGEQYYDEADDDVHDEKFEQVQP